MKPLVWVVSTLLLAFPAVAQHGGGHSGGGHSGGGGSHFGGGGGHYGGGGGGYAGGGSGFRGGGGYGGSVAGHGGYGRYGYTGGRHYGGAYFGAPVYSYGFFPSYGFGYPDSGGYADPGSGYSAPAYSAPQPSDDPGNAGGNYGESFGPGGGQPAPPPPESELQGYQSPVPSPQEEAMSEGRYYLIAYKDHSIYTALAFWMENGVLNYVTPQNAHNQVTLDRVDVDLTRQLNSRRGMPFNVANR